MSSYISKSNAWIPYFSSTCKITFLNKGKENTVGEMSKNRFLKDKGQFQMHKKSPKAACFSST